MGINEKRRLIQQEAVSALSKNNYNGIVLLPTGTGKSWVMIQALKNLKDTGTIKKIWYLCNSEDLRDKGFKEELKTWGAEDLIDDITFMCYQTAYKIKDEQVDVVLADEFDYSLSEEYSKVYFNNLFKHRILVSATIEKERMSLAKDIAPLVYEKELQEIEDGGVVNKSEYYFINFLMTPEETSAYFSHNAKISDAINLKYSPARMKFITLARKRFLNSLQSSQDICRKLMAHIHKNYTGEKVLIFCESNAQASAICKYTYHGDTEEKDNLTAFKNNEFDFMAVCGKINRGANIPSVRHTIIESCNRSRTVLTQRLGRGKRLGVDEVLKVYFLIPHYRRGGRIWPTKVLDWIYDAGRTLQLEDAKLLKI